MNRMNEIMFVDPDFIFIPNKKFHFKFTLDLIKQITKFTSRKWKFSKEFFGISVSPIVKFILLGKPDLMENDNISYKITSRPGEVFRFALFNIYFTSFGRRGSQLNGSNNLEIHGLLTQRGTSLNCSSLCYRIKGWFQFLL